jgi:hypothetical protein
LPSVTSAWGIAPCRVPRGVCHPMPPSGEHPGGWSQESLDLGCGATITPRRARSPAGEAGEGSRPLGRQDLQQSHKDTVGRILYMHPPYVSSRERTGGHGDGAHAGRSRRYTAGRRETDHPKHHRPATADAAFRRPYVLSIPWLKAEPAWATAHVHPHMQAPPCTHRGARGLHVCAAQRGADALVSATPRPSARRDNAIHAVAPPKKAPPDLPLQWRWSTSAWQRGITIVPA